MTLDDLDLRILNQLQQDSGLTNHELARRVHASPPTCLRRVRRLVAQGVVQRQVAILDPGRLGALLTAILEVTLNDQGAERLQAFEQAMDDVPQVQQCYRVSSGPDFVLVVHVADMAGYHALTHRWLTAQHNVRNVRTFFVVNRSKFHTCLPLPKAQGR